MRSQRVSRLLLRIGASILFFGVVLDANARAAQVTYDFSATVNFVDPAASGFPSSLSGVNVGDPITARIRYDASSPSAPNVFAGVFGLATYYPLNAAEISVHVDGVPFEEWAGTLAALVWNNDPTSALPPGVFDGLIYANVTVPNQLQVKIGNTVLSTSTFPNEALPNSPVTGAHTFDLGLLNSGSWVRSGAGSLTQAIAIPGDYNNNGVVDAADYVVWRRTGINGQQGYNDWRTHFGQTAGSGPSTVANAAVPEPSALLVQVLAAAGVCSRRRRAA